MTLKKNKLIVLCSKHILFVRIISYKPYITQVIKMQAFKQLALLKYYQTKNVLQIILKCAYLQPYLRFLDLKRGSKYAHNLHLSFI